MSQQVSSSSTCVFDVVLHLIPYFTVDYVIKSTKKSNQK